jgi:hypothetical protein
MKTKNSILAIKVIVLAALILAACSTGNDFIILAAVAVLLFFLVGDNSDNLLTSKLMFAGAVLGLIISHSVVSLVNTSHHKGPGFVDYGSEGYGKYGGLAGDDFDYEPDVEKVSESEYKRYEYSMNGVLLGFGVFFWFLVAAYAKEINGLEKEKNELEKSWVRMILNPNSVQEIRRHPEHYRDDFKQWIREIQPDLLLPAKDETQHQPSQPQ